MCEMDVFNICRTCLNADGELFSVFDPVVSEEHCSLGLTGVTAAEMLKGFTLVEITEEDNFTTKICTECLDQIHRAYTFKIKCETTQIALKGLREEADVKYSKEIENIIEDIVPKGSESLMKDVNIKNEPNITDNEKISFLADLPSPEMVKRNNDKPPLKRGDDIIRISLSCIEDLAEELLMDELATQDNDMLNMNLNLDCLNDITKELETTDNIIIESGDPFAEPKEAESRWIEDIYECPGCQKAFRKIGLLRNHIVDVHTEGKLCKICNEDYQSSIWKHISGHMPGKDFPCPECNKAFHSDYNMQMHRKMAHNDALKCEHCSMQFRNTQQYRDHVFEHTGKHDFQCDICLKVLKRKSALLLHKQMHSGERPHQCKLCLKSFGYKGNLNFHLSSVHGAEKLLYKCEICSKRFKNRPQLLKHKFEHNGNKELQCEICLEVFETKYKVELHKRKHTGEKPLKCEVCGRGFRLKCNLKEHMGTHSKERPFECKLCPNRYKRTYLLTLHMRKAHPDCNMNTDNNNS